jgi:branched-chain amino acid transport system permease protein
MFWQQVASGLAVGSIYALVALGFILIYKATEVINFAQGELMMVGAFVAYTLIVGFRVPYLAAILLTLIASFLIGVLIERVVVRALVRKPVFSIVMATIGLSTVLQSIAGMIWGYETMTFPAAFSGRPLQFGGIIVSLEHLLTIISTLTLVIVLYIFFKYTFTGIAMQASAQNQFASLLMGIGVKKVSSLTWGISSMIGAVAGILIAPLVYLNVNMGFIGLKAFPAAILGGFGSIPGAIVGGLIIGVTENLAGGYLPGGLKDISAYVVLLAVLMIRPEGIFGIHEKKKV